VGLPGNDATVRGVAAVTMMLVDEAPFVDDDLYLAIRPMLARLVRRQDGISL
jgi:hypothetical protein